MSKILVPVGLSNKHIHLSKEHINILFGEGHELTPIKDLGQPAQFACDEKVDIVGPKGTLKGVRVLGPAREKTQIEISLADGFVLGTKAPIKASGDLAGTPGAKIVGPKGEVDLEEGVIVAARHLHMHTSDGEKFGIKDKDIVKIKVDGERGMIFENVLARVGDTHALELHVDMDEGNAGAMKNGQMVEVIK
ncbi:phosphate propanoyltransferase [Inediibacterium massiliense]|uniref:phosphate propanoyltransferase n=1 Tax=Inediibacterium massiliense TaxID=1658111 RepID=UPI000A4ECAF5|nr:phosphate propanoyltransferase [Inediibacterium massiliense]